MTDEERLHVTAKDIMTRTERYLIILMLMLEGSTHVAGQTERFVTLSNVKARPLAMGGAFTSVVDDMAAINYNPAAYELYKRNKTGRLSVFLNPVSPVVGAIESDKLFSGSNPPGEDLLLGLSLILKSVSLSFNSLELGVLLGEQGLDVPSSHRNEEVFSASGYRQNHTHTLVGRVKLAEQVSIGASANVFYGSRADASDERDRGFGISYGILLKPEKGLNIGVSLINLPDTLKHYRVPLERIVDESVNVGISYRLANSTLSVDVRNLGEEQEENLVREFHLGFEQVLLSHFAIRAGWFKKKNGDHVYSWGVGIFDGNPLWGHERAFNHENFFLNYAFVYERSPIEDTRWHFLSFYLRL
ncbi:MAG: hypothetical protein ACE5IY_10535 [bacterium]